MQLPQQAFHLNQPLLQRLKASQVFVKERDNDITLHSMCRNERKHRSHPSQQLFEPYLMRRPDEAEPSDEVWLAKPRLSKKKQTTTTTKEFHWDTEGTEGPKGD